MENLSCFSIFLTKINYFIITFSLEKDFLLISIKANVNINDKWFKFYNNIFES